jgi:hypothetical protein
MKFGIKGGLPILSARRHQTSFSDYSSLAAPQTGCSQVRPDLAGAFARRRLDRKPVRLCQGYGFIGFHLRRKAGQGDNRSTEGEHYRQGREGFDHGEN